MKHQSKLNNKGFTIWAALSALLILGILATYLGKQSIFGIKTRQRLEAKTSVIDNETTLAELIAARLKNMFAASSGAACGFTKTTFKTNFNATDLLFPAPSIPIKLVSATTEEPYKTFYPKVNTATTSAGVKYELRTAFETCTNTTTGIQIPLAGTDTGVFMFCVAMDMSTSSRTEQRSRSFVFSELALIQVRVDLMYKALSQSEKTFGVVVGGVQKAAPNCSDWISSSVPADDKQMKVSYRILWKSFADDNGYYSYTGSKMINFSELRPF